MTMFKYYVVGDLHGNTVMAYKIMDAAEIEGVHVIFQVGDFGIWNKTDPFLDEVNRVAGEKNIHWYVTLGNHENYDMVEEFQASAQGTFIKCRDNITLLGNKAGMFELDGIKFASLGGAYSIDRYSRKPGLSWWPQEMPTYADLDKLEALANVHGKADVLLTHDAPTSLPTWDGFIKNDPASESSRNAMDTAYQIVRPDLWFHGHYHRALKYKHYDATVIGLGADDKAMPVHSNKAEWGTVVLLTNDDGVLSYAIDNEWIYA
jgi:predicted phosphodiesterase